MNIKERAVSSWRGQCGATISSAMANGFSAALCPTWTGVVSSESKRLQNAFA
jgi:hypothetical protein